MSDLVEFLVSKLFSVSDERSIAFCEPCESFSSSVRCPTTATSASSSLSANNEIMTVPNFFTVAFPTPLIESKSERVVGLEMQMAFAIRAFRNDRCVAQ